MYKLFDEISHVKRDHNFFKHDQTSVMILLACHRHGLTLEWWRKISQLNKLHLVGTCRGLLQTLDDYFNKRRENGTLENTIEIAMHGKDILLSARR